MAGLLEAQVTIDQKPSLTGAKWWMTFSKKRFVKWRLRALLVELLLVQLDVLYVIG